VVLKVIMMIIDFCLSDVKINPDYFCKLLIAKGNSVVYISYNCVLFSYFQGRRRAGALRGEFLPLFFQKESNGGGANCIMGNLIKI